MKEKKRRRRLVLVFMAAVLFIGTFLGSLEEDTVQASQMKTGTVSSDNLKREAISEPSELAQLQVPQRMEIVIDPWEIDGKEQVYSEEYTVQNTGKKPGVLILDFSCETREETGLSFRDNPEGLHDSGDKLIYMKVAFGNSEETVFTRNGAKYQAELQPGETLSLQFTGEVNENAEEPWKDGDIKIEGTYSWEGEAAQSDEELEESYETEKDEAGENILPPEMERDNKVETILPSDPEHSSGGEDQISSSEAEKENIRDSSLSGNDLEE